MLYKTIALVILVALIANVAAECPQEDYDQADKSFSLITVFGHPKASFPESSQGMDNLCKKYNEALASLKDFARRCLNAFSKQTFGLLLRGVSKEMKRYCVKEKSTFIEHNKCGAATISETRVCHGQLVKELKQIINAEQDSKIHFVCCAVYNFQGCLFSTMSSNAVCTKPAAKEFLKLAKGYTEDARALLCGGVEPGSEKCNEANRQFKKLTPSSIRSKSVLLAFLAITQTIIM